MAVATLKQKIKDIVGTSDYNKGKNYDPDYIEYVKKQFTMDNRVTYFFTVESEREYRFYDVSITMQNGNIAKCKCDCVQFYNYNHCKHVSAVLHNYIEQLMITKVAPTSQVLNISKNILKKFSDVERKNAIKEQVKLEIELVPYTNTYYGTGYIDINLKIGIDKMYQLNSKFLNFINDYKNGRTYEFGKCYTFDPHTQYFSDEDNDILNYFTKKMPTDYYGNYRYYSNVFQLNKDKDVYEFLELLKNKPFVINKIGSFNGIIQGNPIVSNLSKDENNQYKYQLELNKIKPINDDLKFIIYENKLYELDTKTSNIIKEMLSNEVNYLLFEEADLNNFCNSILPTFKENVVLDKTVDDLVIASNPITKLYFDLLATKVVCNIKFDYDGNIIDFFDKQDKIIRQYALEEMVLHDLLIHDFINNNKTIYLDDIDKIGNFLEVDLKEFGDKYEVYTSQKLKDTTIIKNTKISSQFSIGKDNILNYTFDIGDIKSEELIKIFNSMEQRKKYYKLKNGNIIDLNNNTELNQLHNLVEDMELSNNDIENGMGVIPKYRAIYLDSLKNTKYNIINTNNLFDDLVNKFTKYKDAPIELSKKDLGILRDYQVEGVRWLTNIHRCGFGGILADEMGLGKSIQVIYFIKQILKEKPSAKVLIVSPTSLVYNWQNEFEKFGSELKYKTFAGLKNDRREELQNFDEYNILITSYGLLRQDNDIYKNICFELCIIDEAQNIKNVTTGVTKVVKEVNANTKIALTGTPIENSVLELWSIFDFIMPGYLANITKFKSKYNVKDVDENDLKVFDDLNKQISAFILRRKKADVILELPEKLENNIYLELYPEQKKLYAAQVEKTRKEMDDMIKTEGFQKARFKILQLLTKLRQICITPQLLYENYDKGSCKIDNLLNIVKDVTKNGHKVLVFTSFRTALEIAKTEFNNNDISSYVIDGSVSSKKRMELVNKFNNDDTNVFLIMLKAGGTGLNLTSADIVIHLDLWWNPQVENQATDRAHRIGQQKVVEVIKLICKGTIEERIMELQKKKKLLSDNLIDGDHRDENILSTLSEKDLKRLISYDNEED